MGFQGFGIAVDGLSPYYKGLLPVFTLYLLLASSLKNVRFSPLKAHAVRLSNRS